MVQSLSSLQLIGRSPDLARLRKEGYEIQIHPSNHLLMNNVPYVTADKAVEYGTLVAPLMLAGEAGTAPPKDHVVFFRGQVPCDAEGKPLTTVVNQSQLFPLGDGLVADHRFSAKPSGNPHADYYALMTTYAAILTQYAQRIDRSATPLTHRAFDLDGEPSVFAYRDTASSRAGIGVVNEKLSVGSVAIVGLGGTGSYVLDLVAKTPVKEIRLYDGDRFTQHNAFRSPGAATLDDVSRVPPLYKVHYFRGKYSALHLNIVAYPEQVDESNVAAIVSADFTFICIDEPAAKRIIIEALEAADKPFIDVGIGVTLEGATLGGTIHTILSTSEKREHRVRVSFGEVDDDYATNIQVADLNALNAALAVIRWKKHLDFYRGTRPEYSSLYTIEWNRLDNGDQA